MMIIGNERQIKQICKADVDDARGTGRPQSTWHKGVWKILNEKIITNHQAERRIQCGPKCLENKCNPLLIDYLLG